MPVYQIRDWSKNFENNRSRTIDNCSFVCVPNKQHGMGFCRVMAEPDGAAIYGIWQCILGACSQQRLPRDGWLTSTGTSPGRHSGVTSWAPSDLALKFRRPVAEIERALSVLCSDSVGWIKCIPSDAQVTPDCPPGDAQVTPECPEGRKEGIEGRKEGSAPPTCDGIPSEQEVRTYGSMHGVTAESCKSFFDYHQGNNLWINRFDRMINWQHKLVEWGNRDRSKPRAINGQPFPPRPGDQIRALDNEIEEHVANSESAYFKHDCTQAQRDDLRALRKKRNELNSNIARANL